LLKLFSWVQLSIHLQAALYTSSFPPLPNILDCLSNLSQRRSLVAGLRWCHTRSTFSTGTSRTEGSCIKAAQPSACILCHSHSICTVIKAITCTVVKHDPAKNVSQTCRSGQTIMEQPVVMWSMHRDASPGQSEHHAHVIALGTAVTG